MIGLWMNMTRGGSPHFATVRPYFGAYSSRRDPLLANVGAHNGIFYAADPNAFRDMFNAIECIRVCRIITPCARKPFF